MNNLLSQLLFRLAQKEADEKRLQTRITSLEVLIAAVISTLDDHKLIKLTEEINLRMKQTTYADGCDEDIRVLLHTIKGMPAVHSQE